MPFLRESCVRPIAAGLLEAVLLVSIHLLLGSAQSFAHLALQGMLAGVGSIAIIISVGLTRDDRQRFLFDPLRRRGEAGMTLEATDI